MFKTYENNAFTKKWPSLVAKFGKQRNQIFIGLTPGTHLIVYSRDVLLERERTGEDLAADVTLTFVRLLVHVTHVFCQRFLQDDLNKNKKDFENSFRTLF